MQKTFQQKPITAWAVEVDGKIYTRQTPGLLYSEDL